jgi:twitching motility protein PilT
LIPRADGRGRVAAIEILKSTARTRDYIEKGEREGKSLYDAMRDGNLEGMQVFDGELDRMIRSGTITMSEGLAYATNRQNLLLELSDMGGGSVGDLMGANSNASDLVA